MSLDIAIDFEIRRLRRKKPPRKGADWLGGVEDDGVGGVIAGVEGEMGFVMAAVVGVLGVSFAEDDSGEGFTVVDSDLEMVSLASDTLEGEKIETVADFGILGTLRTDEDEVAVHRNHTPLQYFGFMV